MPDFASQDFREGLAVGIALNGKLIQPDLHANIWKFAQDSIILPSTPTLSDACAVTFPTLMAVGVSESYTLPAIPTITDDVTISFT